MAIFLRTTALLQKEEVEDGAKPELQHVEILINISASKDDNLQVYKVIKAKEQGHVIVDHFSGDMIHLRLELEEMEEKLIQAGHTII
jgi:hypothetical protein|tara:strand:+ start:449 stop:709 length:261 start_codon:yes stop_codon:yes gene_type:complete